jgi:hypothetical protein
MKDEGKKKMRMLIRNNKITTTIARVLKNHTKSIRGVKLDMQFLFLRQ